MRRECPIAVAALEGLALPGDLLLYRDDSLQETLISRAGRSPYGHAGMLARSGQKWCVLEMTEWHGGRCRLLEEAVREDPGQWDVYLANAGNRWSWDRPRAVAEMWRLAKKPYGWRHVLWVALLHLPIVRAFVPAVTADADADRHAPFCSEAVSIATRLAGVQAVPNLPDRLVEPGDLARSLFYDYALTLVA